MSRENRLKRLGLWHLKDKPKELKEALRQMRKEIESGGLLKKKGRTEG